MCPFISFSSLFLDNTMSLLRSATARPDWANLEVVDVLLHQRHLSHAIDESVYQNLLNSVPSLCFKALAHSSSLPHSGDWLNVIPSPALGLWHQDWEFWYCLCYWLGVPFHSISYSRPVCHKPANPYGDHQVGCGGNADRIARHNAIWKILFDFPRAAALAPTREALDLVANLQVRPADIFS